MVLTLIILILIIDFCFKNVNKVLEEKGSKYFGNNDFKAM